MLDSGMTHYAFPARRFCFDLRVFEYCKGKGFIYKGRTITRQLPAGAKFRRSRQPPLVMPGLGPGIHEFRGDAEIAELRATPHTPRLRVSIFLLNSWMPGPSPGMTVGRLGAPGMEPSHSARAGRFARKS